MVTKYPLLRPAIAFAFGILFASWLPLMWQVGFAAAALLAFIASVWSGQRHLLLLAFWMFMGGSLFSLRYDIRDPTDLRILLDGEAQLIRVAGVLSGDPERRVLEQDGETRYRSTARVSVTEIQRRGVHWEQTHGDVAISTTGFLPEYFVAGARVEVFGVMSHPQGSLAPGLFDFEQYLKWQRIFFVLRADTTNDWRLVRQGERWSTAALYRGFNNWARRTLQRGIPYDENSRLLWAMVLGWKPGLTNEISEPFMRTGTLHVFAISGLHIAMIAAMLVTFLRLFGLPRNYAGAIVIPLIWFYAAATGWQASAIRSTIMCSVIIVGWLLKRPNNLLNSLAASAVLILLWQPEQLFQAGFQLSFILLLSFAVWPGLSPNTPWPNPEMYLGYANPEEWERKPEVNAWTKFLAKTFERLTGRDPFLPPELRPLWRRRADGVVMWFFSALNISLASLVGSLPIIANYFNLISFSSLLANLVIVPLSGFSLGASLLSLVFSWAPLVPELLNWMSWGTMWLMVAICRGLERFTWTFEYVRSPGIAVIIAYYFGLLALLAGRFRFLTIAAAIVIFIPLYREVTTTTVALLPGSGAIFVDAPWTKNDLLVDCGRDYEMATRIKPFLRSRGVDRLNAVALTHGDVAHVEGYARLVREFNPRVTYTSGARSRSPKYRQIVRELESTPQRWRVVAAGDEACGWRVLHPGTNEDFSRADDESIVLSTKLAETTVTLLSELGRGGQQTLVNRGADLKSNVVFAGVPTDGESLRPAIMEALQPKVLIVAGNDPRVLREIRDLRTRATNVIAAAEEGAITLTVSGKKVIVESMTGRRFEIR